VIQMVCKVNGQSARWEEAGGAADLGKGVRQREAPWTNPDLERGRHAARCEWVRLRVEERGRHATRCGGWCVGACVGGCRVCVCVCVCVCVFILAVS
jgi:hypothetical protein